MNHFYCANCDTQVVLDKHGRCERCSSDAVTQYQAYRMPERVPTVEDAIAEGLRELL